MNKINLIIASAILGICGVIGAAVIAYPITKGIDNQRVVNVKGLSEREVLANEVIWPIVYKETSNDLNSLYSKLEKNNNIIKAYLSKEGISENEISIKTPQITDNYTEQYRPENALFRYYATCTILVSTEKVDLVRNLTTRTNELGKEGVTLAQDYYSNEIEYKFTKLNDIKTEMIEEATKNARKTAQKFADDSESDLGKIKTASQGQISITNKDRYTPYIKNLRVVTSVEYFLED